MGVEPGGLVWEREGATAVPRSQGGFQGGKGAAGGAAEVLTTPEVQLLQTPISLFIVKRGKGGWVDGRMGGRRRQEDYCVPCPTIWRRASELQPLMTPRLQKKLVL